MKIVFFGTSGFAVPSLKALTGSRHEVLLVVTQPDRKKGRHLVLKPPAIKEVATSLGIPVFQPENASAPESIKQLKEASADLFVVVSFGQLLSEELLFIPAKFSINLHASLLPKYRGAAPINWAIMNGEEKSGVTVFKLEKRMDAGDIILAKETDVGITDNALVLSERLSYMGANLLSDAVELIDNGEAQLKKQDEAQATFAPKLKKSDGLIEWNTPALALHNRVRGLIPWPSAFTNVKGKTVKILETKVEYCKTRKEGVPGQIVGIEAGLGILVKTKEGCLTIYRLQIEGSRPMGFEEFLRGHRLNVGDIVG